MMSRNWPSDNNTHSYIHIRHSLIRTEEIHVHVHFGLFVILFHKKNPVHQRAMEKKMDVTRCTPRVFTTTPYFI